jgi:hypothetical protein
MSSSNDILMNYLRLYFVTTVTASLTLGGSGCTTANHLVADGRVASLSVVDPRAGERYEYTSMDAKGDWFHTTYTYRTSQGTRNDNADLFKDAIKQALVDLGLFGQFDTNAPLKLEMSVYFASVPREDQSSTWLLNAIVSASTLGVVPMYEPATMTLSCTASKGMLRKDYTEIRKLSQADGLLGTSLYSEKMRYKCIKSMLKEIGNGLKSDGLY